MMYLVSSRVACRWITRAFLVMNECLLCHVFGVTYLMRGVFHAINRNTVIGCNEKINIRDYITSKAMTMQMQYKNIIPSNVCPFGITISILSSECLSECSWVSFHTSSSHSALAHGASRSSRPDDLRYRRRKRRSCWEKGL
jgi:hypothetical protein